MEETSTLWGIIWGRRSNLQPQPVRPSFLISSDCTWTNFPLRLTNFFCTPTDLFTASNINSPSSQQADASGASSEKSFQLFHLNVCWCDAQWFSGSPLARIRRKKRKAAREELWCWESCLRLKTVKRRSFDLRSYPGRITMAALTGANDVCGVLACCRGDLQPRRVFNEFYLFCFIPSTSCSPPHTQ